MNIPLLLSPAQAGKLLGRSDDTIRHWIRNGRLKAQRNGTHYLVPKSEVERLGAVVIDQRKAELVQQARALHAELGVMLARLDAL